MSWSFYTAAKSVEVAKRKVQEAHEPTQDRPWGVPANAKVAMRLALDLAGIEPDCAVELLASGHRPNGTVKIDIRPFKLED